MERSKIDKNLKWNLEDIYATFDDFENDFKETQQIAKNMPNFKNKLNKKEFLLQYYQFFDKFNQKLDKLFHYVLLNRDVDTKNPKFIEAYEKLSNFSANLSEQLAYVSPELSKLPDTYIDEVLKDAKFKNYKYSIEKIRLSRKYVLSETQETALVTAEKYNDGFSEIYDALTSSDFCFEPVKINGQNQVLTEGTYGKFISNPSNDVRAQAYNNLYKTYNQFSQTIATNYIYFIKMCTSDQKLRKIPDFFTRKFESSKISKQLYNTLIKNVDKNLSLEQEYFKLLKQKLNLKDFGFKDVYLSIAGALDKKYTIPMQEQIVVDALAPLGKEYQNLLKKAYTSGWIDFCPHQNKTSGGYMAGVYGIHPYILLNNNDNFNSLTTLAHELGHAMHTYFSCNAQPYSMHDYPIFIAEIASTVNEILLNKYLTNKAKTDEEKLFYLGHYLNNFKSTVFRQTMFSEFEDFAFNTIENGGVLSKQTLDDKYKQLLTKHFAQIVPLDNNIIHEWTRIPHFYTPYYVFQYATSFVSAVYIANSILQNKNNMRENYFKMLSLGGNGYPTEILAKTGIDLLDDSTYKYAFDDMKNALKEAKRLLDKLQNSKSTKK